jgi:hypothetical protein
MAHARGLFLALTVGCFFGGLTLWVTSTKGISAISSVPPVAILVVWFLMPGILGSALFSGISVHFALWTAAVLNCAVYSIVTIAILSVKGTLRRMVNLRK